MDILVLKIVQPVNLPTNKVVLAKNVNHVTTLVALVLPENNVVVLLVKLQTSSITDVVTTLVHLVIPEIILIITQSVLLVTLLV
jgi:hypothetical protein